MSKKIIRVVGVVAAVVAVVATMGSGLGVLLGGAGMMLTGVGSAASIAMVAGAVSLGARLLGGTKKPNMPEQTTNRLYANLDPQAPRRIVFGGPTAMATDIRYQSYTGANQNYLNWIICCASHKVESIDEIWFDSQMVWSKVGGINSAVIDPWFLFIDANEEGVSGNGFAIDANWTASASLTGCAQVFIRFLLTEKNKSTPSPYAQSVPTRITIIGRGMPVPDVRIPGVDPADQSTWVFGESGRVPALQHLAYRLGWRIGGELAVGLGIPPSRLELESYVTSANLCDEDVALAGGGTEPRYRSDGVVSEGDDPGTVLGQLEISMNAVSRDAGGKLALDVLHNDLATPIAHFDENDILGDEIWEQTSPLSESFNVVRGRFADPAALFQLNDYPEVSLDSPDGIERIDTFDLPFVQSPGQAQRLAKQRLQRAQYQGTYSGVFNARAWQALEGRVITLSHSFLGWDSKSFRVAGQGIAVNGRAPMVLVEEHADIYAWDADEAPAVVPGEPTSYDPTLHPWYKQFQAPPNGQLLWDDTFDSFYWPEVNGVTRVHWNSSRAEWAANIAFIADTDVRKRYLTVTDRMPRTFPGKPMFARVTAQPWGVSELAIVEIGEDVVELDTGTEVEPVEIGVTSEANFPLKVAIEWLDTDGGFISRTVIATLDPASGEQTVYGSAIAPDWGLATLSIGYPAQLGGEGTWSAFEPWLAEYEPTADVTGTIPEVPETTIQCDWTGAPKQDLAANPRTVQFTLLRNGEDVTAQAEWSRTLKYGAMNTAIETLGDASPGRLSISYFEVTSTVEVVASYQGQTYRKDHRVTQVKDAAPTSGTSSGGGGGGGTVVSATGTINDLATSTTYESISDAVTITAGASGGAALSASYEFDTNRPSGIQFAYTRWYQWNGAVYVAIGTEKGSSSGYVPVNGEPGLGSNGENVSGLTPGSDYTFRLYGRSSGSWTTSFRGECGASTS